MISIKNLECCGVRELHNISHSKSPADTIQLLQPYFETVDGNEVGKAGNARTGYQKPFLIFTQASHAYPTPKNYGNQLRDFIIQHDLGTVTVTESPLANWTGNYIKVFVWAINPDGIKAYYKSLVKAVQTDKAKPTVGGYYDNSYADFHIAAAEDYD